MGNKCNSHNTDYRTKSNKKLVKWSNDELVIWTDSNKCVVIKQLSINFNLT